MRAELTKLLYECRSLGLIENGVEVSEEDIQAVTTAIEAYVDAGGSMDDMHDGVPLWFHCFRYSAEIDFLMLKLGANYAQKSDAGQTFLEWKQANAGEQMTALPRRRVDPIMRGHTEEAEPLADDFQAQDEDPPAPSGHYRIIDRDVVHLALRGHSEKDISSDVRLKWIRQLSKNGCTRPAAAPQEKIDFAPLRSAFPNFGDAIDFVEEHVCLWMLSDRTAPFKLPPVLLIGPPGVGKTKFTSEVAKLLGLGITFINCASVTAGFVLSGSSVQWGGGSPGKIFTSMVASETINPIIFLDEFDKLKGDKRFDSYGPMYTLFEEETSNDFLDEAIDIPIDCTHISWMLTANSFGEIPPPIISRIKLIDIKPPSEAQMEVVVAQIYADLLGRNEGWKKAFGELSPAVMSKLVSGSPRKAKEALTTGMGRAARRHIAEGNSGPILLLEDDISSQPAKIGIGFLSS